MSAMRKIKFPESLGMKQLSIDGTTYEADELGTFEVPADHAASLLRSYGGEYDPTPESIDQRVEDAKAAVEYAKLVLTAKENALKAAIEVAEAYKKRLAEARAKLAPPKVEEKKPPLSVPNQQQGNQRR